MLRELNPYVTVNVINSLAPEDLAAYSVAVFTENQCGINKMMEFNEAARKAGCGFIMAETPGISGYCFVDYGDKHIMFDPRGEDTKQFIVTSISQGKEAVCIVHEDKRHTYEDGNWVQFTEVEGMTELNGKGPFKIKNCKAYEFTLEVDTTNYGAYTRQGIVEDVKIPVEINFSSLK